MDDVSAEQVSEWIDDDLVEGVDRMADDAAEFNFVVEISGLVVHVIKQRPGGPLMVGQEIEFADAITARIRNMDGPDRGELVARVREALMELPVIYGFQDGSGANVSFVEMERIFLERRIYPDEATQGRLMTALVDVWKGLRYLDDLPSLLEAVER